MFGFLFSALLATTSLAGVGKIIRVEGSQDAQINRVGAKIPMQVEGDLEEGDEIETNNSVVVLHLYPSTQISLNKNSKLQITQALIQESDVGEESTSVIKLLKGLIRLQVIKEINQKINQEVNVGDVSFGVRGTDFEVNANDTSEVDLDVYEGEVTVTSPHVQTFVPEVVKASEGFRFSRKQKQFIRRKFQPKFKNHPGFLDKVSLRERWKKIRPDKMRKVIKLRNKKQTRKQR